MYFKQLIVCMVIAFVCLVGCAPSGVQQGGSNVYVHGGETHIDIGNEDMNVFPSVKKAAKYMAHNIDNQFGTSNKSIVFGFFTTLEKKNRSLLCEKLEEYLKTYLKCKQTIDYERYLKLKKYWAAVGSYGLIKDDTIRMYLNTAHCLVTGTLVLKKHKNVIDILVVGTDSLSGEQLFSTEAALDYSNPDIRDAWGKMSERSDNVIHGHSQISEYGSTNIPQRTLQSDNMLHTSQQMPVRSINSQRSPRNCPGQDDITSYATGYGKNEPMAYHAARVLCDLNFVREYVPPRIVEHTNIKDFEMAKHVVEQRLEGWVPPGIKHEYQHELKHPIKPTNDGKYKSIVGCWLNAYKLDEWVQTQAVAAGLTLKNP
jgi:predicted DNA-binding protein (MmcQ/YjbR family)